MEIRLPRDPQWIDVSRFSLENVTNLTDRVMMNYHWISLINQTSAMIRIEIDPLNLALSYLVNSRVEQIDRWKILCPRGLFGCFSFIADRCEL